MGNWGRVWSLLWLVVLVAGFCAVPGPAAAVYAAEVGAGERPNLVLIIADDMAWNDCGAYGHPAIRTPRIDRLAAEGLRFEQAFLTTSSCSPSRASMITGRYPHNTGAEQLHWPLPAESRTFVQRLHESGYYTAAAGKWHLGEQVRDHFDRVYEASTDGFVLPTAGATNAAPTMVAERPSGCEDWVLSLRERPADRPFFLWLAAIDPHREYRAGALEPPHPSSAVIVPPHLPDTPEVRADLQMYYDEIGRLDRYVGLVLDAMEQEGVAENTVVLFITDNGRPFPRDKTTLYDGGVRTPWIVRWPRAITAGQVTGSLVSAVDIAPTMLDLAGVEVTAGEWEGVSFRPILERPSASVRDYAFSEDHWHDFEDHGRSVRSTRYRLIRNDYVDLPQTPPADAGRSPTWLTMQRLFAAGALMPEQSRCFEPTRPAWELYDLARDPGEFHNVYTDPAYAQVRDELTNALAEWSRATKDFLPTRRTPDEFHRVTGQPDDSVRRRPRPSKLEMFGTNGAY